MIFMKIENSLQSKNISQIQNIFANPEKIFCHVTLASVGSALSRYSTSCRTRLRYWVGGGGEGGGGGVNRGMQILPSSMI